ncbi:hypothetical protein VTI74DRAFT_507 [Chaetomium olivicolor]
MVLKRKRSESELSLGSVFSSSQRIGNDRFNFDAMAAMDTARRGFFAPRMTTPSHLPSRTMKRFRDNRPSESEVFQHTMDVLYSAQRRHHDAPSQSPEIAQSRVPVQLHAQNLHRSHQRSLHSFWNLPGPSASASSLVSSPASSLDSSPSPALAPRSMHTNCEDCGAGLGGGEDDIMTDVEGYVSGMEDQTCGACGKAVCFSCSVSNLGEHHRCLACAGSRGGLNGSSWLRR